MEYVQANFWIGSGEIVDSAWVSSGRYGASVLRKLVDVWVMRGFIWILHPSLRSRVRITRVRVVVGREEWGGERMWTSRELD